METCYGVKFFFFSSRRRHTRFDCDWSSDVCSSDLVADEGWRVRKDGSRFWASIVLSTVRGPGGSLVGFAKVTHDLTERKRAEDELTRSNVELESFRSEEHTSELQSQSNLVCRLLLEKKNKDKSN